MQFQDYYIPQDILEKSDVKISKKDREIMNFIISYLREHGYPPSIREIGLAVGLSSTASVHAHMKKLFDLRLIETDAEPGTPRAIRIPGYKFVRDEAYEERKANKDKENSSRNGRT